MDHPFADLIGLQVDKSDGSSSEVSLTVRPDLLNPNGVTHGAVLYALADTGMGAAIAGSLKENEICATVAIKVNYFKAVYEGAITCTSRIVNRGKRMANVESDVLVDGHLVARANGDFAIFIPGSGG